jgi:Raf kinase inhibitor-like YbhB/YbcL family protein
MWTYSKLSRLFTIPLLLFICLAAPISADSPEKDKAPPIQLASRAFTPPPGLDPALATLQASAADAPRHLLIQLHTIPTEAERAALEAAGVRLLGYIHTNAWLASVSGSLDLAAPAYALIRWAGPLLPQDKIEPVILQQGLWPWAVAPDGRVQLQILFFEDVPAGQAAEVLARHGGQVQTAGAVSPRYIAWFPKADVVTALAAEDGVQWVESGPAPRSTREDPSGSGADGLITIQNDLARLRTNVNTLQTAQPGLTGSGVVIGIWDSGQVAPHPDFTGRLTVKTTDSVDTSGGGHATHVAGTAAGDGRESINHGGLANQWRGVASGATILSYSFNDSDIEAGHQEAIGLGLDISQNSWGDTIDGQSCALFGDYTANDKMFDEIIAGKYGKGVVVSIAVGNDRDSAIGENWCGITDGYGTIGPPSGAKNGIGVGATLSEDDAMTFFSVWGPTDDGRLKPDVVAPGDSATQAIRSTIVSGTPGNYTYGYGPSQGTSMATPHVSGIAALLVQRYKAVFGQSPLPSTIKALLIHTAADLDDATPHYNPGPDYASGYGRVDALAAYNVLTTDNITEDNVANGGADVFTTTVTAGATSLKVTLVWDDPAAEPNDTGQKRLINDLDLELVAPDGATLHRPWLLNPANPGANATRGVDSTNNVEQVLVANPAAGVWTVRVKGTSVPQGPQKYSLIGVKGQAQTASAPMYLPLITKNAQFSNFALASSAFTEGGTIPDKYTHNLPPQCAGQNFSPPLAWTGRPSGTQSFALIVADPDGGDWVHWVQFNIPATTSNLNEAVGGPGVGVKGKNDWDELGYGGPCPPSGDHRYFFKLYALDTTLALAAGATRAQVEAAMSGHILGQAQLMGRRAP